jgi:hypothetical protein
MSKHNHNTSPTSSLRCSCGRYGTLGEQHAGVSHMGYKCPDCFHRQYAKPLTREEYYEQMSR